MAAYAALVSLLNNIHQIMNHPCLSTSLNTEHIQPLIEKTGFLLDFIEGYKYGGDSQEAAELERKISSAAHAAEDLIESHIVDQIHAAKYLIESNIVDPINEAEDLIESNIVDQISAESNIVDPVDEAEDLIESHIVDQIHEERLRWPYLLTFLLKCVGCHLNDRSEDLQQINEDMDATMKEANESHEKYSCRLEEEPITDSGVGLESVSCHAIHRSEEPLDLQHVIEEMDAIIEETNGFKEKGRLQEEQQPTHVAEPLRDGGESGMVGLDAELNQLLDELTGYQSSRRIISIVGMGGTGKTTLAKNVYDNLLVKEKFQFRAWATISQQNNAQEVLSKLLSGLEVGSRGIVDDLGLQLHKTLLGRRYLIILDDIWSVKAWDEVKRFFPDNKNGSRILLTTRLSNVARDCGSSLVRMNLLDEENSWKLFCKKAFQNDDCPSELRYMGEVIVKLCKGLALSIVVIGGLLVKSPRTVQYWNKVARDLKSIPNSKEKQESLDVLCLSYNHLPPHLKPCFLYMGVFKEDSEIHVSKIIKLWVGEGFIKPIGSLILEEIAWGHIKDLIDRNLILVLRSRKNGKVKSCIIHDLLRDLCIKLAEQEKFFHVSRWEIRGIERRLVHNWYTEWIGVRFVVTRSIMTWGCKQPNVCRLLRVLDEVPSGIQANYFGNVNLRYLAYNHANDVNLPWKLPTSVSSIWNLQTLIIKGASACLIVVPTEFWKMRQLRHVQSHKIYIPDPPRSNGLSMLENLQTLKRIFNLRLSEEVCRIIPNIKELHLVYDTKMHGYDDSLVEYLCNLGRLHKLDSLKLSLSFKGNTKLISSLPRSLNMLVLVLFELHLDDLAIIGSLSQLQVLQLRSGYAFRQGQWSPVDGQFLCLKFLKIDDCYLRRWEADDSHFPVLEKLILIGLQWLEEIPLGIGDIPTLQLIRVDSCSNSAAISAVRIQEDQRDNGGQLQVQVRVLKRDVESFNQMLETEGLTIDNIQLEIF